MGMKIVRNDGSCVEDERKSPSCAYMTEIQEMHRAIYGNGSPEHGLYWKVSTNTDFIAEFKKNLNLFMWILIPAIISAIGTFIVLVFKLIIKVF